MPRHARFEVYPVTTKVYGGILPDPPFASPVRLEWRWRLRAANGRILASGEGFKSKSNAARAIETVIYAANDATKNGIIWREVES